MQTTTLIKTNVRVRTSFLVALVGTIVASAIGIYYISAMPAILLAPTQVDLVVRSVSLVDSATMKFNFTVCNNGISLNQYYKSTQSAYSLQFITYNNYGESSQKYAISMGGSLVSNLANGNCQVVSNYVLPAPQAMKDEYKITKMISFLADPKNSLPESNELNNAFHFSEKAGIILTRSFPADRLISPGSKAVMAGRWVVDARFAKENIKITGLAVTANTAGKTGNFKLFDGSVLIGSQPGILPAGNGKVLSFNLATPVTIIKNSNKNLNLFFDLSTASLNGEINSFGLAAGAVKVAALANGTMPFVLFKPEAGAIQTVRVVSLSAAKSSLLPNGQVTPGNDVKLGSYELKLKGEEAIVSQIKVQFDFTSINVTNLASAINSVRLIAEDNTVLAGPINIDQMTKAANFTGTFVLPVGTKVVSVIANIPADAGWSGGDTIFTSLVNPPLDIKAIGKISTFPAVISPATKISGQTMTLAVTNVPALSISRSSAFAGAQAPIMTSNVQIAAFDWNVKYESIAVSALKLEVTYVSDNPINLALMQFKLVDAAGNVLAGPVDVDANTKIVTFNDTFTLPIGLNQLKILATTGTAGNGEAFYVSYTNPVTDITAVGSSSKLAAVISPAGYLQGQNMNFAGAKLGVSRSSLPVNGTVVAGTNNVLIGSWILDASNSGEDIRVESIIVRASTTGKIDTLTLKDVSGNTLAPIDSSLIYPSNSASSTLVLTTPLSVPKGQTKEINLYGNVLLDNVPGQVFAFGISAPINVFAYGLTSGTRASVTVTGTQNKGVLFTVIGGATLTINVDSSAEPSRIVLAGATGVSLADIRLKAIGDGVDITILPVGIGMVGLAGTVWGGSDDINRFYLKLDGNIIGNVSGYSLIPPVTVINLDRGVLSVPTGSVGKRLVLVADIAEMGLGMPAIPNSWISMGIGSNGASGITAISNSNSPAKISYFTSTGSPIILHTDFPTVSVLSGDVHLSLISKLMSVRFSSRSAVGINKVTFHVLTSDVTVNSYQLVDESGMILASTTAPVNGYLVFDPAILTNSTPVTLSLRAVMGGNIGSSARILASFVSDSYNYSGTFSTVSNQSNFVWSDFSADPIDGPMNPNRFNLNQWYNGKFLSLLAPTTTYVINF